MILLFIFIKKNVNMSKSMILIIVRKEKNIILQRTK